MTKCYYTLYLDSGKNRWTSIPNLEKIIIPHIFIEISHLIKYFINIGRAKMIIKVHKLSVLYSIKWPIIY